MPETLLRTLYTLSYVIHTTILKLESVSSFMDERTEREVRGHIHSKLWPGE